MSKERMFSSHKQPMKKFIPKHVFEHIEGHLNFYNCFVRTTMLKAKTLFENSLKLLKASISLKLPRKK